MGALGGATVVCALALVLGPPGSVLSALDALQARLIAVRAPALKASSAAVAPAAFTLFGRGAAPTLRLDGVAISPGRKAALISINGASAEWVEAGDTRDGVTLVEVGAGAVVVDSDAGSQTVKLGEGPPSPSTAGPTATPVRPAFVSPIQPFPGATDPSQPSNFAALPGGPPPRPAITPPGLRGPPVMGPLRPPMAGARTGSNQQQVGRAVGRS